MVLALVSTKIPHIAAPVYAVSAQVAPVGPDIPAVQIRMLLVVAQVASIVPDVACVLPDVAAVRAKVITRGRKGRQADRGSKKRASGNFRQASK